MEKSVSPGGNGSVATVTDNMSLVGATHQGALKTLRERRMLRGDSWYNVRSKFGGVNSDPVIMSTYTRKRARIARDEAEVLYEFEWLAARIVDQIARDATREWITFKHEKDPDKAEALREEDDRLSGRSVFEEGIKWGNLHGSSLLVLGAWDGREPEEPLEVEKVRKLMFAHVIDRWLAFPSDWYRDPDEGLFGTVRVYRVHRLSIIGSPTSMVHESRVIRFDGNALPPLARVRNWGWGASVLDKVYDALRNWGISNQAAASIIPSFITFAMQMNNLQQMLANQDFAGIQARLAEFRGQMATQNVAFYGEGEKIEKMGTPVTGLPELIDKFMNIVSGAAGIPKSILFQSESGSLGGTSSLTDQDNWFNKVVNYQEVTLRPKVRRWLDVIGAPLGLKPGEVDFEFNNLKKATPEQEADLYNKIMTGDNLAVNSGMVDSAERLGEYRFGGAKFNAALPVVDTTRIKKFLAELDKEPIVAHDPRAQEGLGIEQSALNLEQQNEPGFDGEGKPEEKGDGQDSDLGLRLDKMSKAQRDKLSEKIAKLMKEGKPQKEAVAIAHSMLGLSRDSAEVVVSSKPQPRSLDIVAVRRDDGTLRATVREVAPVLPTKVQPDE